MSPALTLFCDLKDPYTVLGLEHFLTRTGFSPCDSPQNAAIFMGDSDAGAGNNRVKVLFSPGETGKMCDLTFKAEKIPLFCTPQIQTGEYVAAVAAEGNRQYAAIAVNREVVQVGFNLLAETGRFLAGYYDSYFLKQDELGVRLRSIPVVDALEEALFSAICTALDEPVPTRRFSWPDNHKFALVLTHDVDRIYKTYQYLPSILNSIKKARLTDLVYHMKNLCFKPGASNPYWTFDVIDNLEKSLGVKSTYYFLNEKGRHNPFSPQSWILYRGVYKINSTPVKRVIKTILEKGNEVGVHGSYNSFNDAELLKAEKQALESITGTRMKGIRQHYLNYDNLVTSGIQSRLGFEYDSSIGFKPESGAGFRRGTSFPFKVMSADENMVDLLEIPLIIMDGALDTALKIEDCYKLIDQVEKYSGVLTILWHTQRFNKREYPSMSGIYQDIIRAARQKGAWIAGAGEVYDWIVKRPNLTEGRRLGGD